MSNDPQQSLIQALLAQQPSPPPAPLQTKTFVDSGVSREPVVPSSSYASTRGGSGEAGTPATPLNLAFMPVAEGSTVTVLSGNLTLGFGSAISVSGLNTPIGFSNGDLVYLEIDFNSDGEPTSGEVKVGSWGSYPERSEFDELSGDLEGIFVQTKAYHVIATMSDGQPVSVCAGNVTMRLVLADGKVAHMPFIAS